jgi:hypothetical protein
MMVLKELNSPPYVPRTILTPPPEGRTKLCVLAPTNHTTKVALDVAIATEEHGLATTAALPCAGRRAVVLPQSHYRFLLLATQCGRGMGSGGWWCYSRCPRWRGDWRHAPVGAVRPRLSHCPRSGPPGMCSSV